MRAKASDIPDDLILAIVQKYAIGGLYPTDALDQYPKKVVIQKLRKAEGRGWIQRSGRNGLVVTPAGRAVLEGEAA